MALPHSLQRTMIVAPHPDDDVIAASGLIQRVVGGGGELRVVFVTDGDNNPWPQRLLHRTWFLGPEQRAAWGTTRRNEALCSLALLGIAESAATFLALPDSGIARMARDGDGRIADRIEEIARQFQPTLIVGPSTFDLHSDHRAVSYFTHRALPDAPIVTYVVHGRAPAERLALRIALSDREKERKREAIECHRSQLALSRRRFLAYARASESFYRPEYDIVRVDSTTRNKMIDIRYGIRIVFGLDPAPEKSDADSVSGAVDGPIHSRRM